MKMAKDCAPLGDRRYKINKGVGLPALKERDFVKELAWEVARNVIDHHKWVYSKIFESAPSTFPISLRNGIYNEIESAIKCKTDEEIAHWIARSEAHRKEMQRLKRLSKKANAANGDPQGIEEIINAIKKKSPERNGG